MFDAVVLGTILLKLFGKGHLLKRFLILLHLLFQKIPYLCKLYSTSSAQKLSNNNLFSHVSEMFHLIMKLFVLAISVMNCPVFLITLIYLFNLLIDLKRMDDENKLSVLAQFDDCCRGFNYFVNNSEKGETKCFARKL